VTGRFSAGLRATPGGNRLTITGSFQGLAVAPSPAGCVGNVSDNDPTVDADLEVTDVPDDEEE